MKIHYMNYNRGFKEPPTCCFLCYFVDVPFETTGDIDVEQKSSTQSEHILTHTLFSFRLYGLSVPHGPFLMIFRVKPFLPPHDGRLGSFLFFRGGRLVENKNLYPRPALWLVAGSVSPSLR